ncbi:MAG: hypothetical protein GTN70_06320 [Deltaproteobacteria bacterium]|nr:hypothetical protein [Deltaproteobacteria bacterium]NIS77296.1 hypothetical protein [Deltaproteobacteria bacterium]
MEGMLVVTGSWISWFGGLLLFLVAASAILLAEEYEEEKKRIREAVWAHFPPSYREEAKSGRDDLDRAA